jgi:radical SAM protein with 4Fe4S-binding SPASM domain
VRLGDLSIVPCHRLSYDELLLGKFIIEDNKIIDVVGYNPELFLYIRTFNPQLNHLKCDTCAYQNLCIKGCLGMEYEKFR